MGQGKDDFEKSVFSLNEIKSRVIEKGLCVFCGACVNICPYFIFYEGRIACPDFCGLKKGLCSSVCPVLTNQKALNHYTEFIEKNNVYQVGKVLRSYQARSKINSSQTQYGGVTSLLASLLISEKWVKQVILTKRDSNGLPRPFTACNEKEVYSASGAVYASSGSVMSLNKALFSKKDQKIAFVGLPCQILAAKNIRKQKDYYTDPKRLEFTLGLFCTWNLSWESLNSIIRSNDIKEVTGYDVPPPPAEKFLIKTKEKEYCLPLGQIREKVLPGCGSCPDLTAQYADISLGALEGKEGWNCVLVRTVKGERLIDIALEKDLLEVKDLPKESWDHLNMASKNKLHRALKQVREQRNG